MKLFFLGDFTDRGVNDIEVLTIFLLLKILNPNSVFLLQGNHENPEVQVQYSREASFFCYWKELFSAIYRTFPVGMSCDEPEGRICLGHAASPLSEDLRGYHLWKAIPKETIVQEFQSRKGVSPKQQQAIEELRHILPEDALKGEMTNWADIGPDVFPSKRGAGYVITDKVIQHSLRANDFKFLLRGHEHVYQDVIVKGKNGKEKVICTTLPAATAANMYGRNGEQQNQGILFEPHGKVRNWRKWIDRAHGRGMEFKYVPVPPPPVGMYEQFPSE